ncbi:putative membrane protein [Streptococcus pneumoniae 2081074]|nr:putative membrane protein [Streptococcus pneumoniae 2081074]
MELVLPNNYVALEQEEMMYLDGGAYLSKSACQGICAAAGVLALIFLIKICVDTTIKVLLNRIFKASKVMKRRIFSLFVLDLMVYIFLGYVLVIQKDVYLFSILIIFSNFSVPFIREKEYELFKNKK